MKTDELVHVPGALYWLTQGFVSACVGELEFRAVRAGETKFEGETDIGEEEENGDITRLGGMFTGPWRRDNFRDWAFQIVFLERRNMESPATEPDGYPDETHSVPEAFHLMRESLVGYGAYVGEKLDPLDVSVTVEDTFKLFSPACWTARVQVVPPLRQAEGFGILLQLAVVPELSWLDPIWRRDFWVELIVFVARERSKHRPASKRRRHPQQPKKSGVQ